MQATIHTPLPALETADDKLLTVYLSEVNTHLPAFANKSSLPISAAIAFLARPDIAQYISHFHRLRESTQRMIALNHLRDLVEVSEDPVEQRRAATTILRTLGSPPPPAGSGEGVNDGESGPRARRPVRRPTPRPPAAVSAPTPTPAATDSAPGTPSSARPSLSPQPTTCPAPNPPATALIPTINFGSSARNHPPTPASNTAGIIVTNNSSVATLDAGTLSLATHPPPSPSDGNTP